MIGLYIYLAGYIVTLFGIFTHLKYNSIKKDGYNGRIYHERIDGEDIFTKAAQALAWPIVLLYFSASKSAIKLKTHEENKLAQEKEKKKLAEEHKKILKENGINF